MTLTRIAARALLFVSVMLTSLAAQAQITVFPECNFQGVPVSIDPGNYTKRDLARIGIRDNVISSIVVSEGFGVRLHRDDNFSGRAASLTGIMQCLDEDFNDAISSLQVGTADQIDALTLRAEAPVLGDDEGVTVYTECDYRGRSATLSNGEYTAGDLRAAGISDNTISSIKVPKGMSITLYQNDFQRGQSGELSANNDCLVDRYNNAVSSVVVSGEAESTMDAVSDKGDPALVFTGCNFKGAGARLPPGEYLAADLKRLGIADNAISSIRAPAGMEIVVYANDFLRGRSAVVTGEERCLTGTRFEGTISSIKVVHESEGSQSKPVKVVSGVTFYEECYYEGKSVTLEVGEYTAGDLASKGLRDNTISSVKVPRGYRTVGYENDFSRGGRVTLDESVECLSTRRADNAISSLIVELSGVKPMESDKTSMSVADRRRLTQGIACVSDYVEQQLCISNAWPIIVKNCELDKVPLMTDGYLEQHVKAGNCVSAKWNTLSSRIADPLTR